MLDTEKLTNMMLVVKAANAVMDRYLDFEATSEVHVEDVNAIEDEQSFETDYESDENGNDDRTESSSHLAAYDFNRALEDENSFRLDFEEFAEITVTDCISDSNHAAQESRDVNIESSEVEGQEKCNLFDFEQLPEITNTNDVSDENHAAKESRDESVECPEVDEQENFNIFDKDLYLPEAVEPSWRYSTEVHDVLLPKSEEIPIKQYKRKEKLSPIASTADNPDIVNNEAIKVLQSKKAKSATNKSQKKGAQKKVVQKKGTLRKGVQRIRKQKKRTPRKGTQKKGAQRKARKSNVRKEEGKMLQDYKGKYKVTSTLYEGESIRMKIIRV